MISIRTEHIKQSLNGLPEPRNNQIGCEVGYLFTSGIAICAVCHYKLIIAGFLVVDDGQFVWAEASNKLIGKVCAGCGKNHTTMHHEATSSGPSSLLNGVTEIS